MKSSAIFATVKKSSDVRFEVHEDDAITLMMHSKGAHGDICVEIDRRPLSQAKYIFHEWLSQLVKIWNERKISVTGMYDYHDSINPYDLKTGERSGSSNMAVLRKYILCNRTIILNGGKRFLSEDDMDSFVMAFCSELKRKVKKLNKGITIDDHFYIYGNISTGSIDECIIGWTNLMTHDVKTLLRNKK